MEVQTGLKFLALCEHPSGVQRVSYERPSSVNIGNVLNVFVPLLPLLSQEGTVYWHPGPDHYGMVELNGRTPMWLFYRDNLLLASDNITLDAIIETPSVERLWKHRGLPKDAELLARAQLVREETIARCMARNAHAIAEVKKRAPIVYFSDTWRDGLEPLQEFPKRITVSAPSDPLAYLATYRRLPSLPWD